MNLEELEKSIADRHPVRVILGPYVLDLEKAGLKLNCILNVKGKEKALVDLSVIFRIDRNKAQVARERYELEKRNNDYGNDSL